MFDARYNLVLVPATKHSVLRRWLARRGFALAGETLCQAAGRWYAVMNARYTGACREPDGLECLCGLTNGQPGCGDYYAQQNAKLKIPPRPACWAGSRSGGCAHQTNGGVVMLVTVQQILGLLQTLAPSELACSWDNVGLLVDVGVPVSHVLTTLDITAAVVQEQWRTTAS